MNMPPPDQDHIGLVAPVAAGLVAPPPLTPAVPDFAARRRPLTYMRHVPGVHGPATAIHTSPSCVAGRTGLTGHVPRPLSSAPSTGSPADPSTGPSGSTSAATRSERP